MEEDNEEANEAARYPPELIVFVNELELADAVSRLPFPGANPE